MYRKFASAILCVAVLALASATALAASKNGVTTSKNGRQTIATKPQTKVFQPYVDNDAPASTIFSNLGSAYPLGVYWCCTGGTISGPLSIIGTEYWEAIGFTPSANANVTKIAVAVGYVTGATTDVILSLTKDSGGVPGAVLKKWKLKSMPSFGSCCVVDQKGGASIPVTAGTPYWVTVSTESNSDIWAAWNMNDVDQVTPVPTAYAVGGVWTSYMGYPGFGVKVVGQ